MFRYILCNGVTPIINVGSHAKKTASQINLILDCMKTFCKTILIVGFVMIGTFGLHAQSADNKLDQVDLMKKVVGRWQCELGKDTVLISDNVAFGTGLICSSQIIANGEIHHSVKQLYGYDKKIDKFIIAELIESSPVIEVCNSWFTSQNTGEIVVTNPENAPFRFKFEFKNADLIVQTAIQNDKVVQEISLIRIKDEK